MDARVQELAKAVRGEIVGIYKELQARNPTPVKTYQDLCWYGQLLVRLERVGADLQRLGVALPVEPRKREGEAVVSPLCLSVRDAVMWCDSSKDWIAAKLFDLTTWSVQMRRLVEDLDRLLGSEPDHVDDDYSEPRTKAEWRGMLEVSETTFRRQIAGEAPKYRLYPGTNPKAKRIRIHIDDLPSELRTLKQRKDKAAKLNRQ